MSAEPPDFVARFMDDYYAEADEHIVTVRRSLLALETALGSELPRAVLDELFRSFHSLKGISAMVELREAEMLAHQMESCLRAIRDGELPLTAENFETLVNGTHLLEEVILARQREAPLPAVGGFLAQLETLARSRPSAHRSARSEEGGPRPRASGEAPRWRVTFTPSAQLVERGIKVDSIRARLLAVGDVLKVEPRVLGDSGISFVFEVRTRDEAQLAAWRDDGVAYEAIPEPAPAEDGEAGAVIDDASAGGRRVWDTTSGSANFVRVDLARLDELMRLISDMVVTRARLEDTLGRIEAHVPFHDWRALQEHSGGLERQLHDLRDGVMRVRLVPVGEIFRRMPFVVRDLARDSGKRVHLDLVGQSVEIDKFLIERMMDPVVHLVRNAVSHAIEPPAERTALGKAPEGLVRLSASTAGESVVIEVADDGRGIDIDEVTRRARAQGISVPDGAVDDRALLDILCASGFSTRDEADRASGRGVGMAVVRAAVRELGGALSVETEPWRGTTFRLTLPLTLAITDAIIAQVGSHTFAVPQSSVREVIDLDASALRAIEGNELMAYRGGSLPMVRLARLFGLDGRGTARLHAIVIGTGRSAIGLVVDRISGQREIVVKTITDPLIRVHGVSGATELGDGRLVLILDVAALSRALREGPAAAQGAA